MTAASAHCAAAPLRVEPVDGRRDLDRFIRLPRRLYRGQAGYVAPLTTELRRTLSPRKNPYFGHATARLWLAYRGARPVGRISAQIDRLYLERHGDAAGHFGFLDAEDDAATFRALTASAEDWLRAQGLRRVRGPFNLSINEECGLLVDGFAARSMMMMGFAPPYAGRRLAEQGYGKAKDLLAYDYDLDTVPPIDSHGLLDRVQAGGRVAVRPLDMAHYDRDLAVILDIFNDAWADNWGFVPFTEAEIVQAAAALRPLVRPELVWIAEVDGVPAAMIVALPNLNEAIADLDGELLPFGWLKLLWRLKFHRFRTARVPLFGVRRRYHRSALGAALVLLMLGALRRDGARLGFRAAELSWILEDNLAVRRVIESVGGRVYKTYRIYEKALA